MAKLGDMFFQRLDFALKSSMKQEKKLTWEAAKRRTLIALFQSSIGIAIMLVGGSVSPLIPQIAKSKVYHDVGCFLLSVFALIIPVLLRFSGPLNPGKFVSETRKRFGIPLWFVFGTSHLISLYVSREGSQGNLCFSAGFSGISIFVVATVRVTANFEQDSILVSRSIILQSLLATTLGWYTGNSFPAFVSSIPVVTGLLAHIPCPGSLEHLYCDSTDRLPFIFLKFRSYNF